MGSKYIDARRHPEDVVRVDHIGIAHLEKRFLVIAQQARPGWTDAKPLTFVVGNDEQIVAEFPQAVTLASPLDHPLFQRLIETAKFLLLTLPLADIPEIHR